MDIIESPDGRTWDEMTDEEIVGLYEAEGNAAYGRIVVDVMRHGRKLLFHGLG